MRYSLLAIFYCVLLAGCTFLSPCGLVGGFRWFRWEGKLLETPHNHTPTGCSINSSINLYALHHQITWGGSFNRRHVVQSDIGGIKCCDTEFEIDSCLAFSGTKVVGLWTVCRRTDKRIGFTLNFTVRIKPDYCHTATANMSLRNHNSNWIHIVNSLYVRGKLQICL